MSAKILLAATKNKGKVRELGQLLSELPFELKGLADLGIDADVDETGSTFLENAEIKAIEYARLAGVMTLADDSGLSVDALGGAPGVFSARYAGPGATDSERIAKLLDEIKDKQNRDARFVCAIAVADGAGRILASVEGECRGRIAFHPSGLNGFGYDPIFVPDGFEATFGDLSDDIKSRISHRADATSKIKRFFADFWGRLT